VYRSADQVLSDCGQVDILVNNAGIVHADAFFDTDDARLSATIDVNLKSMIWTMKAFLPGMIERDEGHVVNIASAAGFMGMPRLPAYCASKSGVIGLTESVRGEIRETGVYGVRFSLVCPSFVDTGMFEGATPPALTRMLRPERIVDIAYEAVKQNRFMIAEPFMVKLTPPLKSLLPQRVFDFLADRFGINRSMKSFKGHDR